MTPIVVCFDCLSVGCHVHLVWSFIPGIFSSTCSFPSFLFTTNQSFFALFDSIGKRSQNTEQLCKASSSTSWFLWSIIPLCPHPNFRSPAHHHRYRDAAQVYLKSNPQNHFSWELLVLCYTYDERVNSYQSRDACILHTLISLSTVARLKLVTSHLTSSSF